MKKLLLICLLSLMSPNVQGQLFSELPGQTMLLSGVAKVEIVDSFLVSAGPGGVTVFVYDSQSNLFTFSNHLPLSIDSVDAQRFGDYLYIPFEEAKLYVIDISNLPVMTLVDSLQFNEPFADFAVNGDDLYLGVYFNGVQKYDISGALPVMTDSSMQGVLVTDILYEQDTLYVLDEYNGLLRYDLSSADLHQVIDIIYCPDRVFAFEKNGSQIFLQRLAGGMFEADSRLNGLAALVDLFAEERLVKRLFVSNEYYITVDDRNITFFDKLTKTIETFLFVQNNIPNGALYTFNGLPSLLLPDTRGGVTVFPLDLLTEPFQGLDHGSGIHDIILTDSVLILSGINEPVKLFSVDDTGYVNFDYAIYENLPNTTEMALNGDSLFTIYPELDRNVLYLNSLDPDSLYLELSFSVGAAGVNEMLYHDFVINNRTLLLTLQKNSVDFYLVSDSGFVDEGGSWQFPATVTAVNIIDTFLFAANSKKQILTYILRDDYTLDFQETFGMSGLATGTTKRGDSVYFFEGNSIYHLYADDTIGVVSDTAITLPLPVTAGCFQGNYLFTAGYNGIGAYELINGTVELRQSGGIAADVLVVNDRILVASNGNGIYIYNLTLPVPFSDEGSGDTAGQLITLRQNYPNPFNAATSIRLSLARSSTIRLDVFNLLGQLVATPVNTEYAAGELVLEWDGTNQNGQTVASGVYFYRVSSDGFSATKKMVLLK